MTTRLAHGQRQALTGAGEQVRAGACPVQLLGLARLAGDFQGEGHGSKRPDSMTLSGGVSWRMGGTLLAVGPAGIRMVLPEVESASDGW